MRWTIAILVLAWSLPAFGQKLPPAAAADREALLDSFKLVSRSDFEGALALLKSASELAAKYKADQLLVEDSIVLALLYGKHQQIDKGKALLVRLSKLPLLEQEEYLKLQLFKAQGDLCIRERNYDDALQFYDTIFHFDTSLIEIETVLLNRSLLYIYDDRFKQALADLRYIEPRYLAKKDDTNLAIVYMRLAEILDESRDYQGALKYYKKIPELEGIPPALKGSAYYRLGGIYKRLGNDSAFFYYRQVLAHPKQVSKSVYNKVLGSMCSSFLSMENPDSIQYYCDLFEADCAAHQIENSSLYWRKAKRAHFENNLPLAVRYLQQATDFYLQHENDDADYFNDMLYRLIGRKIELSGDTTLLREFDDFRTLNLELRKRTVSEEVELARIAFETEKIALENQLLTKEKQLLQQSKATQLILFSLLALALVVTSLFFLNRYRKEKAIRTDFERENKSFLQKLSLFKQQELSYEQLSKEQVELTENRKIPVAAVIYISAHERGSIVQTVDGPKNHYYSLKDWETTLADLGLFLRVHKSHLLNLSHYHSRRYDKSTLMVELSNGEKIPVGRKYKGALLQQLDRFDTVVQS